MVKEIKLQDMYVRVRVGQSDTVVIFAHGLGASYVVFEEEAEMLHRELDYTTVTFNFRFGRGDHSELMTLETELEDYEVILEAFKNYQHIYIWGESQGGLLTALMAERHPELDGAILYYPAYNIPMWANMVLAQKDPDLSFHGMALSKTYFEVASKTRVSYRFEKPVLIIHGNEDVLVDYHLSIEASEKLKNATLHIIDQAGHGFKNEKMLEAYHHVKDWLKIQQNH